MNQQQRWQDWIMALVGLWLLASPWLLPIFHLETAPQGNAMWNAVIAGLVVMIIGIVALLRQDAWEEWVDLAAGLWLFLSPWALGFSDHRGATWNAWLCGMAVFALAG